MKLTVKLELQDLFQTVVHEICVAGSSPTKAVSLALQVHIQNRFAVALGGRTIKPPFMSRPGIGSGGADTLKTLAEKGYDPWYLEIKFSTLPGDIVEILEIQSDGIELVPIDYGQGIQIVHGIKHKPLKTKSNHVVKINHVRIPGSFFESVLAAVRDEGKIEQPLLANFRPDKRVGGPSFVSFDHMVSGVRRFCGCSRSFHAYRLDDAKRRAPGYAPDSWPHRIISMLEGAQYTDSMCHLCIARHHSDEEAIRRYGGDIESEFIAFIPQVAFDLGVDDKTARANIMQVLGLSRWVREASLYRVLQELFPEQTILREASPIWLGRMRLDMYIPDLALAVEHQGEQHFRPITAFGGEGAHLKVLERDRLKRELCRENGVTVVDVRFDAPLTRSAIANRLQRYLLGT